jgi:DNA recombination protein RmuC
MLVALFVGSVVLSVALQLLGQWLVQRYFATQPTELPVLVAEPDPTLQQLVGRVESMHNSLDTHIGELGKVSTGVTRLGAILTNVKTRGNFGEAQLGTLLNDMLTPAQFDTNVVITGANRVEFVVKLPGPDGELLLPIDAKFPLEDYQRLCAAAEADDADGVKAAGQALELQIKACAKAVRSKYINPPLTTDFALLFLPTESLFAEVLRRPGLADAVRRDHQVLLTGPSTLCAVLSSFQVGFRTLALEQRSREIWRVLAATKQEFSAYVVATGALRKKVEAVTGSLDDLEKRGRAVERALKALETTQEPGQ